MAQSKNNKTVEYISLAEYEAYRNRIFPEDRAVREWTEIEERDAMLATLDEMYKRLMPEIGMGATEILWSDRRAKTIVEVVNPNKVRVMENKTECLDWYGNSYKILDELESGFGQGTFTRRKSGRWVEEGQPDKFGSVYLRIGHRAHSIDPSF